MFVEAFEKALRFLGLIILPSVVACFFMLAVMYDTAFGYGDGATNILLLLMPLLLGLLSLVVYLYIAKGVWWFKKLALGLPLFLVNTYFLYVMMTMD